MRIFLPLRVLVLIAIAMTSLGSLTAQQAPGIGEPSPAIELSAWINAPDGKAPTTASLKGKLVMLEFWGTWCGPCVRAMPHVQELHDRYSDQGLVVLAISYESTAKMKGFLAKHSYTMPVGSDPKKTVVRAYGVRSWPSTFLIGKDGSLLFKGGPYSVEAAIEKALGIPSDAGNLLSAYLETRGDKTAKASSRTLLEQLARKATNDFDLAHWATEQGAQTSDGTQPSSVRINKKRVLDRLASDWHKSDKRALVLASLVSAKDIAVDLAAWSSQELEKRFPISKKEFAGLLSDKRYEPAIDAIASGRLEKKALRLATKHKGLKAFCRGKSESARKNAKKGIMAEHWVFAGKTAEDNASFFRELSISGMATSKDKKRITGIILGGALVEASAVDAYIHQQYARALIATSLAKGKAPKLSQLETEIQKQRQRQLKALVVKYGEGKQR